MKINLLLDSPKDCLSGYINIDPISDPTKPGEEPTLFHEDVNNFDAVCDDSEATEINAINVLSYFPARDINDIFTYWLKKLRHGGVLRIGDVDILEVAKSIATGAISIEDANLLLYGEQDQPWRYRKSALTVNQVANALVSKGYRILKKRLHNNNFVLEAQRP